MNGSLGLLDTALCVVEQGIFPDLFQRLLAQDMLCLAGILGGDLLVHAQLHKEVGLQAVDGEGNLTLLEPGREIAERIYGRHRLLTHFFMQLGVDEKTAAEDACKAEHILSEQTLEKIRERALETDSELTKPAE